MISILRSLKVWVIIFTSKIKFTYIALVNGIIHKLARYHTKSCTAGWRVEETVETASSGISWGDVTLDLYERVCSCIPVVVRPRNSFEGGCIFLELGKNLHDPPTNFAFFLRI